MTKKQKSLVAILAVVAVVSVGIIIGGMYFLNSKPLLDPDDTWVAPDVKPEEDGVITVLVSGIDSDSTRSQALTDVNLLVCYSIADQSVKILQIPRDTYINDKFPTGKFNAVYSTYRPDGKQGVAAMAQVIEDCFKIQVDHYILVTMDGFKNAVDAVDGVEVDVPMAMELNGTSIKAGRQLLDGEHAIVLVRTRNTFSAGDIGRIQVSQRLFLAELAKKLQGLSAAEMSSVAAKVYEHISSDMSVNEILEYGGALKEISFSNMEICLLPGEATMRADLSVYSMHKEAVAALLNLKFRFGEDPVPAEDLAIIELRNTTDIYDDEADSFEDLLN